MQLTVVLFFAIAASVVLVSSHPVGEEQDSSDVTVGGPALARDKRTVGILRDLFPNFSQMIDRKIQMLTRFIFRIVGRLILQGGNRGGGGGGGGDDDDRRIQITLPTYPPDELDDEDEDSTGDSTNSDTETTTNADSENSVGETKKREVRAKREADPKTDEEEEEDLEPDATGDNEVSSDNEAEADGDDNDDEDPRNKRFLNFNLGGSASAGAGGSGNFLFDIIRLVAGSGNTQSGDAQNGALEEGKDDAAYGVGVPGPLTRLFVVANKGVAALIQDLILRLAQTSERIVNFKARLITSII